jgi:hypothetical protein
MDFKSTRPVRSTGQLSCCGRAVLRRRTACSDTSNGTWIKHDAQWLPDRRRGEVVAELGFHHPRVSMRCDNFSPHHSIAGLGTRCSPLFRWCFVDVRYALTHVESRLIARIHAFDLQSRLLRMLVLQAALVANIHGLGVQSYWLDHRAGPLSDKE